MPTTWTDDTCASFTVAGVISGAYRYILPHLCLAADLGLGTTGNCLGGRPRRLTGSSVTTTAGGRHLFPDQI